MQLDKWIEKCVLTITVVPHTSCHDTADTSAAEGAVAAAAGEQAAAHVVDATTLPTVELEPSLLQRQNEWVPEVKTRKEKVRGCAHTCMLYGRR